MNINNSNLDKGKGGEILPNIPAHSRKTQPVAPEPLYLTFYQSQLLGKADTQKLLESPTQVDRDEFLLWVFESKEALKNPLEVL